MAKTYDWQKLKRKYICGDYANLKEFAEKENVEYRTLRKNAVGWREQRKAKQKQKSDKIIDKTIEKGAERAAKLNERHILLYEKALDALETAYDQLTMSCDVSGNAFETNLINANKLKTLIQSLEIAQKGQRLALGMDKQAGESNEDKLMSAFDLIAKTFSEAD